VKQVRERLTQSVVDCPDADTAAAGDDDDDGGDNVVPFFRFLRAGIPAPCSDSESYSTCTVHPEKLTKSLSSVVVVHEESPFHRGQNKFTSFCPCRWTTKSLKIFKDFSCCNLSVMYDHMTSINSVTATVHEDTTKNSLLTEYRCRLQVYVNVVIFIFMANKAPAVVQFAYTLKLLSLSSSQKSFLDYNTVYYAVCTT